MVNFKIIFQNNSNSTLENIRLADLFPQPGDSVSREERESMWKPAPGSYTVYKYDKTKEERFSSAGVHIYRSFQ